MGSPLFRLLPALCLLLTVVQPSQAWKNSYDNKLQFTCPKGQFINSMMSRHDNSKEDRLFDFTCADLPVPRPDHYIPCAWSYYVNDFDAPVVFQCNHNGYIAGISSYHDSYYKDRRSKFYCCNVHRTMVLNCYYTGWLNNWDEVFSYTVPDGWILRGMVSFHNNDKEDRRFQLNICKLVKVI